MKRVPGGWTVALLKARTVERNGCWEWTGWRNEWGYAVLDFTGIGKWRIHRLVWTILNGPIPKGMLVLHRCDNPPCINPDHLFLGTWADNVHDCHAKGRGAVGERNGHSRLTASVVRKVRHMAAMGMSYQAIGRALDIDGSTAGQIARGQRWSHLRESEGT